MPPPRPGAGLGYRSSARRSVVGEGMSIVEQLAESLCTYALLGFRLARNFNRDAYTPSLLPLTQCGIITEKGKSEAIMPGTSDGGTTGVAQGDSYMGRHNRVSSTI